MSEERNVPGHQEVTILRYFVIATGLILVLHVVLLIEFARRLGDIGEAIRLALGISPHDRLVGVVLIMIPVLIAAESASARRSLKNFTFKALATSALCAGFTAALIKLSESKFVATGYPLVDFYLLWGGGGLVSGLLLYAFLRCFFWLFPRV